MNWIEYLLSAEIIRMPQKCIVSYNTICNNAVRVKSLSAYWAYHKFFFFFYLRVVSLIAELGI